MSTSLEQCLNCVVDIYHYYCTLDPVDDYLHLNEFRAFMRQQAPSFLWRTTPPNMHVDQYIQRIFRNADRNQNGYLHFTEFASVISSILDDAHNSSHDYGQKSSGHGHRH
ncbi:protein S100-A7-like [Heteronotia binoei]|uniref:protein S100-A7-like n=1 Tax=Heteronotia binoei TaxID=13085 RepID=UPI00292D628D|nr:protein S100-A7-like [Heteronotia binoei]